MNTERAGKPEPRSEPIFKSVFGLGWDDLPPVIKKHYSNHPCTTQATVAKGALDLRCRPPLSWLAPLMKLLGYIPALNETNVPVTVRFESDTASGAFHLKRIFYLPKKKAYKFFSRMYQIKGNELVEIMRLGLAWKMKYSWDGEKVILSHKGYALALFGRLFPLPLTALIGVASAREYPIDDDNFAMEFTITHPWWGTVYGYKGRFEVLS